LTNLAHNIFKPILLVGDFNCNVNKTKICEKTKNLIQMTIQNGLNLANDTNIMTYGYPNNRGSAIDLIFYNKYVTLNKFEVMGHIEIKHHPVKSTFTMKIENQITNNSNHESRRKPARKLDLEKLFYLVNHDYLIMSELLDNDNIEAFYLHILDVIEKSKQIPRKSNRISKPWFDSECYLTRKSLIEMYHAIIQSNFSNENLIDTFKQTQISYKTLLKEKRINFNIQRENGIILKAEQEAYLYFKRPIDVHEKVQNPIDMEEWVKHMRKIVNNDNLHENDLLELKSLLDSYDDTKVLKYPFLDGEIMLAAKDLKNNKAPGPDMITNENIKDLVYFLLPMIKLFFNKCLETGKIPKQWKHSTMKLLYKNKGSLNDCNSYRGICLSNTLCKLLDKILSNRILSVFHDIIPKEQYGFMPGRSTIQAAKLLHKNLSDAVTTKGTKKYAIFIDLTKAFDLSNRTILFQKIIDKNKLSKKELNLLAEFLQCDFITINDGISESDPFVQSNGVKQGMNSSPLLFNIYIHDIIKIFEGIEGVEFLFYADDMVFLSDSLEKIQIVMQKLLLYAELNYLKINFSKTKMMKYTINGLGKYSKEELNFEVAGEKIEFVKCFSYLGIYFQRQCCNFTEHIIQRKKNAVLAMNMYGDLRKLSINCAKRIFHMKFAPMASYGIELIWPTLTVNNLRELETVKSRYFKRVLGVGKKNKNTYVYKLVDEPLFVADLKNQYNLPDTENYVKFLSMYTAEHMSRFNVKFLETPAMRNDVWKQPLFETNRHVFTRFAIHGFHDKICNQTVDDKKCFEESDLCVCTLCGEKCTQYHLAECEKRVQSINAYATRKSK
jgi:hypothetical protein